MTRLRLTGFADELADHGRRFPWLWIVPLAGIAARELINGVLTRGLRGAGALGAMFLTTFVVAVFAELWIDGGVIDAGRLFKAIVLFVSPYPALLLIGWILSLVLRLLLDASQAQSVAPMLNGWLMI